MREQWSSQFYEISKEGGIQLRKYFLVLLVFIFSFSMSIAVYAETQDIILDIEIENEVIGNELLEDESFFYEIKAVDVEYPMPEETIVSVEGQGNVSFENFVYTTPGIYEYQIYQLVGEEETCNYDETIYEVTVYITNDGSGGLDSTVYAIKSGTDLKSASITFTNTYEEIIDPDSETTGNATTGDNTDISYILFLMVLSVSMIVMLREKKRLDNKV